MHKWTILLILALPVPLRANGLAEAVATVFRDSQRLTAKDRCFARYLYWPDEGEKRERINYLLTLIQCNLRSTTGSFGKPVRVVPGIYRIDMRDYDWHKKAEVWERFAGLDPFFHMKLKLLENRSEGHITYWPGGPQGGKDYKAGPFKLNLKEGDILDGPALWCDPLVQLPGGGPVISMYDTLRKDHLTEAPILFGPWWFVQTTRQLSIRNKDEGTGPYDFLGIKSREDMFSLAGLNEKKARERFAAWAAVIEGGTSGISQQNRQIVLMRGATGFIWGTLDVFAEKDGGVVKRNLRPGEFKHDAEEWVYHLPNGMLGEALFNNKGVTQASAPPEIGGDKSPLNVGNDPRVHVGLCTRCHGVDKDGIKPITDWARDTFRLTKGKGHLLQDQEKGTKIELESLYLRDIARLETADRAEYSFAVANLTVSNDIPPGLTPAQMAERHYYPKGMTFAQMTKLYVEEGWNRYVEERVTLERAALELGVTSKRLQESLFKYNADRGGGDLVLTAFVADPPRKISRLEWENSYGFTQVITRGLKIPEIYSKVRKGP
jgi:hypothetical protein